jgi:hypothetical protein
MDEDLINIEQAAEMLPWSVPTLRRWRASWPTGGRKGPTPMLVEGRLFYSRRNVDEWFRRQREQLDGQRPSQEP